MLVAVLVAAAGCAPAVPAEGFADNPPEATSFLRTVAAGAQASDAATNEAQRSQARAERDRALCSTLGPGLVARGWTGVVRSVSANGAGKGVLEVEIAEGVRLQTAHSAFGDVGKGTLVEPSSRVFDLLQLLEEGDKIRLSGRFVRDGEECPAEGSLLLEEAMQSPSFYFDFSDLAAAQ